MSVVPRKCIVPECNDPMEIFGLCRFHSLTKHPFHCNTAYRNGGTIQNGMDHHSRDLLQEMSFAERSVEELWSQYRWMGLA